MENIVIIIDLHIKFNFTLIWGYICLQISHSNLWGEHKSGDVCDRIPHIDSTDHFQQIEPFWKCLKILRTNYKDLDFGKLSFYELIFYRLTKSPAEKTWGGSNSFLSNVFFCFYTPFLVPHTTSPSWWLWNRISWALTIWLTENMCWQEVSLKGSSCLDVVENKGENTGGSREK